MTVKTFSKLELLAVVHEVRSYARPKAEGPKRFEARLRPRTQNLMNWTEGSGDHSADVQSLLIALMVDTLWDAAKVEELFKQSRFYSDPSSKWNPKVGGKWEVRREEELALAAQRSRDNSDWLSKKVKKAQEEAEAEPEFDLSPEGIDKAFCAVCDSEDVAPAQVVVDELLIRKGIHVWAGLFESYKTMFGLEMASKILAGLKVAGQFMLCPGWAEADKDPFLGSLEVLWLNLDMPPTLLKEYSSPFGLAKNKRFRWNDPKRAGQIASIDDPRLPLAVKGRLVFIDTMLDLANIRNAFESTEWISFFKKLRRLIEVYGAEAIVLIAHPTKASQKTSVIDPVDYLKDSVTFGGKVDVAFAFRNVPKTGTVHIERIKGRGFKEREFSFSVAVVDDQGDSFLGRGEFPVCVKPVEKTPFAAKTEKAKPGPKTKKSEYEPKVRAILERHRSDRLLDLAAKEPTAAEIFDEIGGEAAGLEFNTVRAWISAIKKELF